MVIQKETDCVLLAGRHQGLAEGIRGLLETAFQVVVMVANETSLFESAKRLPASLAVLDASLVGKGGFRVLRQLRETAPTLKLIVISAHDQSSVGQLAFNAGADAFVLQRAISTDLLPAVDAVRAGKRFVSRSTLSRIGFQQPHSTKFSDQH
jgi:DNA-binding NarL/FixJ family response regulator